MIVTLSPRERDVIALLADGLTQKAIAVRLRVSQSRIEHVVATLKLKYGAANCSQLVHMWNIARSEPS